MSRQTETARNVAIVLLLGAAVYAIPAAGTTANVISLLVSAAFLVALAWFAGRMYREYRVPIYGLGERHRAILYASIGGVVFLVVAASRMLETGLGTLLWFTLMVAAAAGFVAVVQHARADSY